MNKWLEPLANERGIWGFLSFLISAGSTLASWLGGASQQSGQEKLALKAEAENERLGKKLETIENTEWGWKKADILDEAARTEESMKENQVISGNFYSSKGESERKLYAKQIADMINRTESSRAMRRELQKDVEETQFNMNYTWPLEYGVTGGSGYDIAQNVLGMLGIGAKYGQETEKLDKLTNTLNQASNVSSMFSSGGAGGGLNIAGIAPSLMKFLQ